MAVKELDFDELDKAVNSLMNKGEVEDKDGPAPTQTLDIGETLAPDEAPAYSNLRQAAEKIGSEAIDRPEKTVSLSESPTPRKRSKPGRYMDVVHSSSDMRPTPHGSASHQGKTIDADEDLEFPKTEDPEPMAITTTAGNLPASSEQPSPPEPKTHSLPEPLSSPFIPDAKVEKRPLGGSSSEASAALTDSDALDTSETGAPTSPEPELPEPSKTDEEDKEIEALKHDESTATLEGSSKMDAQNVASTSNEEMNIHIPEEYQNDILAVEQSGGGILSPEAKEQESTSVPLGMASIPKQYQEKPSSGDTTNGAIFDTTSYHKPFSSAKKENSVLKWAIAVVAVVIAGVGVGAGVFFFVR